MLQHRFKRALGSRTSRAPNTGDEIGKSPPLGMWHVEASVGDNANANEYLRTLLEQSPVRSRPPANAPLQYSDFS